MQSLAHVEALRWFQKAANLATFFLEHETSKKASEWNFFKTERFFKKTDHESVVKSTFLHHETFKKASKWTLLKTERFFKRTDNTFRLTPLLRAHWERVMAKLCFTITAQVRSWQNSLFQRCFVDRHVGSEIGNHERSDSACPSRTQTIERPHSRNWTRSIYSTYFVSQSQVTRLDSKATTKFFLPILFLIFPILFCRKCKTCRNCKIAGIAFAMWSHFQRLRRNHSTFVSNFNVTIFYSLFITLLISSSILSPFPTKYIQNRLPLLSRTCCLQQFAPRGQ